MKSSFFEYEVSEQPIQEVWDDPETIFVFDTNIFLGLYVFHEDSRQKIYDALDKIKERLWSPHQVMLEFHRNRKRHIEKNKKYFDNDFIDDFLKQLTEPYIKLQHLRDSYGKNYSDLGQLIDSFKENAEKDFSANFETLYKSLKERLTPIRDKLADLQSQLITSKDQDGLYQRLKELYPDNKIGKPFTQSELNELYKEGEQRFQNNVPPGYSDKVKHEIYHHRGVIYHSKFGDLILYKQILEHCKAHEIKNIIVISGENAKGDWVDKSNKVIRKEIRGEAFEIAGIQNFIMMNLKLFSEYGKVDDDERLKQDFYGLALEDPYRGFVKQNDLEDMGSNIFSLYFNQNITDVDKYRILHNLMSENHDVSILDYNDIQRSLYTDRGILIVYKVITSFILKDKLTLFNVEEEFKRIIKDNRIDAESKMNLLLYICGIDNEHDINSYLFSMYPSKLLKLLQEQRNEEAYNCANQCYNEKNFDNQLSS